jgi:hypothetical protein
LVRNPVQHFSYQTFLPLPRAPGFELQADVLGDGDGFLDITRVVVVMAGFEEVLDGLLLRLGQLVEPPAPVGGSASMPLDKLIG